MTVRQVSFDGGSGERISFASSAKEIARYVDAVLAATGAKQVDLVGHSQGGLQIRQYLRFEGGANPSDPSKNKVKNAISLSGSNHGTTLLGITHSIRRATRASGSPAASTPP